MNNCGFYMARWRMYGVTSDGTEIMSAEKRVCTDNYTTFKDGDNADFVLIKIEVSPLEDD